MLLHYLGKLKYQKFALCMHVKHISSVIFYHLSKRYLPNVMKISANINTMQNLNTTFCSFTVLKELKERLIVVWSDFWQDIIDTVIDQCRQHLQACVRANGHLNTFCEQTLANNLQFSCVFGSSGFCPSGQIFTVLMLDGRQAYLA